MINKIVCKIDLSWTFVSYLSFGYKIQVVNIESCLTKLIQALDEEERWIQHKSFLTLQSFEEMWFQGCRGRFSQWGGAKEKFWREETGQGASKAKEARTLWASGGKKKAKMEVYLTEDIPNTCFQNCGTVRVYLRYEASYISQVVFLHQNLSLTIHAQLRHF